MGVYLCICRLQPGPHAKSGDSNDVNLGRVCSALGSKETLWPITDTAKPLLQSQNRDTWRESKTCCPFFRSLLDAIRAVGSRRGPCPCTCRLWDTFGSGFHEGRWKPVAATGSYTLAN